MHAQNLAEIQYDDAWRRNSYYVNYNATTSPQRRNTFIS